MVFCSWQNPSFEKLVKPDGDPSSAAAQKLCEACLSDQDSFHKEVYKVFTLLSEAEGKLC